MPTLILRVRYFWLMFRYQRLRRKLLHGLRESRDLRTNSIRFDSI